LIGFCQLRGIKLDSFVCESFGLLYILIRFHLSSSLLVDLIVNKGADHAK
jgi:hypothetical protein